MTKKNLEDIIHPHKLNHGVHDTLIKNVEAANSISPNVMTIAMNAYYKIPNRRFKSGFCESDIDLIQLFYDSEIYNIEDWNEVPFADATLLVFEMKSHDSVRNHRKAMHQLNRTKNMIRRNTKYQNIDCFYAHNIGNSYTWKYEDIK